MSDRNAPPAGELDVLRARTVAELEHQLRSRRIDEVEFELRASEARSALTALDLRSVLTGVTRFAGAPTSDSNQGWGEIAKSASAAAVGRPSGPESDRDWILALMSGSGRSGVWEPAENVMVFSCMGGVRLDFREAAFLEGVVTRVSIFALMGGCKIIVPPDIHVSVAGTGLMGGFSHVDQTALEPDAPRLHIVGLAVMGGVNVQVREPGESPEDDGTDESA